MIPLDYVSRLTWNEELGARLKRLRGKVSRRSLAETLKSSGHNCSHQYIQKLEDGDSLSVGLDLILGICKALKISLGQLIPMMHVEQPEN